MVTEKKILIEIIRMKCRTNFLQTTNLQIQKTRNGKAAWIAKRGQKSSTVAIQ